MKLVRRSDTLPEVEVRRLLTKLGLKYRTCVRDLPGSPDIVNRKAGWAVFVHGRRRVLCEMGGGDGDFGITRSRLT